MVPSELWNVDKLLDGELKHPIADKTVVFSFKTPTMEHRLECTYMHTTPVLLSDSINGKLHSVVQEQSSYVATVQANQYMYSWMPTITL